MIVAVEFVPYLGALTGVVVLGLAALTTFDNVGHALLVPGSFLAINLIQANLVTPMLLGHRLTLNPVAIFVGLDVLLLDLGRRRRLSRGAAAWRRSRSFAIISVRSPRSASFSVSATTANPASRPQPKAETV